MAEQHLERPTVPVQDLSRGQTICCSEQAEPSQRLPDRIGILAEHSPNNVLHLGDLIGTEALDAAEVQENYRPVATEQVVARMRVGVEGAKPAEAPQGEAVD